LAQIVDKLADWGQTGLRVLDPGLGRARRGKGMIGSATAGVESMFHSNHEVPCDRHIVGNAKHRIPILGLERPGIDWMA